MEQPSVIDKALASEKLKSIIEPPKLPEFKRYRELFPGCKEEKSSLDEGEAILIWPENLSAASVLDLEYWLKGVLNKAKRRAGMSVEDD